MPPLLTQNVVEGSWKKKRKTASEDIVSRFPEGNFFQLRSDLEKTINFFGWHPTENPLRATM